MRKKEYYIFTIDENEHDFHIQAELITSPSCCAHCGHLKFHRHEVKTQLHKRLRFGFMTVQLVMVAVDTTKRRNSKFHLEVKIMCVFIYCKNVKVFQIQQIQGRYLLGSVTQGILIHASKSGIAISPFLILFFTVVRFLLDYFGWWPREKVARRIQGDEDHLTV